MAGQRAVGSPKALKQRQSVSRETLERPPDLRRPSREMAEIVESGRAVDHRRPVAPSYAGFGAAVSLHPAGGPMPCWIWVAAPDFQGWSWPFWAFAGSNWSRVIRRRRFSCAKFHVKRGRAFVVHACRIEELDEKAADVVTARALAPLDRLRTDDVQVHGHGQYRSCTEGRGRGGRIG